MSTAAWFFASAVMCLIGAYVAVFTVTTHKGLHGWVAFSFMIGAFMNIILIVASILKQQ